jgi:hypothetical protein
MINAMRCTEGVGCCNASPWKETQLKWGAIGTTAGNLENSARLEIYEEESANRSNAKYVVSGPDIFSTNIDTLVPSLYQCVEPAA